MKESLKNKFGFKKYDEGEVVEKKISIDFESLIGSLKNVIVFIISILVSSVKLLSRSKSFWNCYFCSDKFSGSSTYNSMGSN